MLGRRVRAHIYKRDQYERVVATVFVRHPPLWVPRRDVGLALLRAGLATTYEAKTGVEFGGAESERRYRAAEEEARRRGMGMWRGTRGAGGAGAGWWRGKEGGGKVLESPREFKDRMRARDKRSEGKGPVDGKGTAGGKATADAARKGA